MRATASTLMPLKACVKSMLPPTMHASGDAMLRRTEVRGRPCASLWSHVARAAFDLKGPLCWITHALYRLPRGSPHVQSNRDTRQPAFGRADRHRGRAPGVDAGMLSEL